MIELKQVGHGDARVDYGTERPRYRALARRIDLYYRDLLHPLEVFRQRLETMLGLPKVTKADKEAARDMFLAAVLPLATKAESEPFQFNRARQRATDAALDTFLEALAGPDRSEEGFVAGGITSDTPDGIIQQQNILALAVGLQRGSDLLNMPQTLTAGRNNPATEKMLENAFARLSSGGQMRLESVRDEIHGILAGAAEAGLSPLDTARQLSKRFEDYSQYEFQRLSRTEAAFASEEGVRAQMEELGVTHYTVLIDVSACSICQGYVGLIIPADGDLPPYHPNCLCSASPAGIGEMMLG